MKFTDALTSLDRIEKVLYDETPEHIALAAARQALCFVHELARRNGPVSIPALETLKRFGVEAEPVAERPLKDIRAPASNKAPEV